MVTPFGNRRRWAKPSNWSISSTSLLSGILLIFSIFYVLVAIVFFVQHNNVTATNNAIHQEKQMDALHRMDASANQQQQQQQQQQQPVMEQMPKVAAVATNPPQQTEAPRLRDYEYWKDVAVTLAGRTADQVIQTLEHDDPFGVRKFERDLVQAESERGAFVDMTDLSTLFPCPPTHKRITLPDQRNREQGRAFRKSVHQISSMNITDTAFLFFQHLRKAGGTNFCTLAEKNLHRSNIPSYYCMPDMEWSGNKCAGCLTAYDNDEIVKRMRENKHLILGNEWDNFDPSRFFDLPAVFATSFRKPLDRALSQFRFECIEDRGCKIKKIEDWWQRRNDLTNVYTWTFSDMAIRRISRGRTADDAQQRQEAMAIALDTVAKFNLVMVMEWLAYAPNHVSNVLGFGDTTTLTTRVRPHISQFERNDGQEKNVLGAAGIAKASWTPKDYLSPEQYTIMSEDLALDEILTDAARRLFLERIVCKKEDFIEAA